MRSEPALRDQVALYQTRSNPDLPNLLAWHIDSRPWVASVGRTSVVLV
jgi:hypothetical protein